MKKIDLAYTAGIIDGEGSIGIYTDNLKRKHPCYCLQVGVTSADEWLPMWLKFAFGGYVYKMETPPQHKTKWYWTVRARQAKNFIELVLPYLRLKREQAEIAIKFQSRKRHYGRSIKPQSERILDEVEAIRLKEMKHRGKQI